MNGPNNGAINIEIISFNKGLFSSEAITRSKLNIKKSEADIQIKHTIWNGPIIYTGTNVKPFDFQLARVISVPMEFPKSLDLDLNITSVFSFVGSIDIYLQGNKFNFKKENINVQFQNWTANMHLFKHLSNLKADSLIPAVTIDFMGMVFQVNNIVTKLDLNQTPFGNWIGNSNLIIEKMVAELPGVEVSNINSQEISSIKDNLISLDWKLKVDKVNIAKEVYGPLNVNLLLNKLNASVLAEISKTKGELKDPEGTVKKFLLERPEILIKDSNFRIPQGLISDLTPISRSRNYEHNINW